MRTHSLSAVVFVFSLINASALAGPIHNAAKVGDAKEVERLIAAGTQVDERDRADKTPLHWAAEANQAAVARLLVNNGADVNAGDFNGLAVLSVATLADDERMVELLINAGPT